MYIDARCVNQLLLFVLWAEKSKLLFFFISDLGMIETKITMMEIFSYI